MANNPFAPVAAAPVAAAAAPVVDAPDAAAPEEPKRKRVAKALTVDQHKEIIKRALEGATPKETATAMGIERNQAYNFVRKFKASLQAILDDETAEAARKELAQKQLDLFPVREFGATAGEKRSSSSSSAIADLLAEAGL